MSLIDEIRMDNALASAKKFVQETKEPVEFAFVPKCRALVKDYRSARKQHIAKSDEIKRNYNGDRQKREIDAHNAAEPDKDQVIRQLYAHSKTYSDYLNGLEAAALDTDDGLTAAFNWLSRPVTLTAEELQKLHDRHADHPIFCRALSEYYAKHEDSYKNTILDLRDSITVRRELVAGFVKNCERYVRDMDDWDFNFADAGDYFETIDAKLKGNGLFAQPKVIEPDEGEEPTAPEAPEPDAFSMGFKGAV